MTRRPSYAYTYASVVVGGALLLTAYRENPSWMLLLAFLFVLFPRWRRTMLRLAEKAITKATSWFSHDRCDPPY